MELRYYSALRENGKAKPTRTDLEGCETQQDPTYACIPEGTLNMIGLLWPNFLAFVIAVLRVEPLLTTVI